MDLETVIQSGVSQNEKNKCINAYVWNLEKRYKERKCRSFSHVQLFVTPWTGHGILQARILEWVAILFSRGSSQPGIKPRSPALQAEKWYRWSYLQNRNKDTEEENYGQQGGKDGVGCIASWDWPVYTIDFSCCLVTKLCLTLGMDCITPGSSVSTGSWSLLKFMSIKLVMLSNHLILCHPLLLLPSVFPSIRVFSNESALHIRNDELFDSGQVA